MIVLQEQQKLMKERRPIKMILLNKHAVAPVFAHINLLSRRLLDILNKYGSKKELFSKKCFMLYCITSFTMIWTTFI